MGSFANGPLRNTAVWLTAAAIIAMSLALVVATVVLPLLGVDVG